MKKCMNILRSALALVLTAAALAGPLAMPAARVRADGAEFDLGDSAFTQPEYDTCMMYFWHKGLPTVAKDKQGNYIKYPVLITWNNDKNFLCTDANFKNELNETHTLQKKKNNHYIFMGGYVNNGYLSSEAFDHDDFDRVWGDTDYYMRYLYDMSEAGLVSKLGLDIASLQILGEAVSIVWPEGLPYLVPTSPETDQYAIGLDERVFGQDVWLVGRTRTWQKVPVDSWWGYDEMQEGQVQWCLDYQSWSANRFCDKNYTYKSTRTMYDVDTHKSYDYSEGKDQHYWTVKQDSNGKYHFWTLGENTIQSWGRISGTQGKELNRQRTRDWYHANDVGRVNLYFSGSTIGASTPTVKNKDWNTRINTVDNTDGYNLYYADPNIVSFYRHGFSVAKGQVVTLDGPCVLDNQCTVTVQDGGVLACSGWVINNGQINVEPGGMLILQDRDTATGDYQYGCISTVGMGAGTASGRIACDGTIIVNRDCKLACAGKYGLKLGSSAQVVNYGQIITENLTVNADHIIENRGDTSAVFAGWGVTDSAYALTRTRISSQSYNAKGNRENTCAVSVVRDAVYGDGAARFYVNSAASFSYIEKNKEFVSGFVAKIDGTSYEAPALPGNIPIYYDADYGVAFIKVEGVIYQYDGLVGRWVNISDGANETYFDYRMPDVEEMYDSEKLPKGFILSDGRVVGQEVNEDLYYDWHVGVYWCYDATIWYFYEPTLAKYIHTLDDNTYCVCTSELAPPPNYNPDHIPSSMYMELPMGARPYHSGMKEVENSFGKPEVKVENGKYYVEIENVRLWWIERFRMFLPQKYSVIDGEPQGGLTETQVNWGYYDPDMDPNAKPKVNKDEYGYYILYHGSTYYWSSQHQGFFISGPYGPSGTPVTKDQVDLNGYTLP